MKPSKIEWGIALLLFLFLFASWDFEDTTIIVGHQIDFADAIVHGEFRNPYQRAYDRTVDFQKNGNNNGRYAPPYYDLPVNFVLGIWGLPLYILGGIDYVGNFAKILYGKSFFFIAFTISAWLVYKICRVLNLSDTKSQWGAFIYFTSSMAWNSVCLVGNIDAICTALTLAGILAYLRGRDRECFVWFMMAFPFKQLAAFIYLPLLLLKDKNIFRDALKMIAVAAVNVICNIPVLNCPGAVAAKAMFMRMMIQRLFMRTIPFMSSEVSVFVILYGLLCVYCWLSPIPSDEHKRNHMTLFVAMTSIAVTLSTITAHPQWFLYFAPYLAVAVMYYKKFTKEILLFETLGSLGLLGYNYVQYYWVYVPKCGLNMLLDKLLGHRKIMELSNVKAAITSTTPSGKRLIDIIRFYVTSPTGAIYTCCMIVIILWLCRFQNTDSEHDINMRPYALTRLLANAAACYIPLIFFVSTIL